MGICAFFYMSNLLGVVVFHRSMLNWRGSICHGYMCILLYVKLIGCSGVSQIYAQLEGVHLPCVYVHSSIYETYWVQWFSRHLCSNGGGVESVCHGYMCILLYVKLIWCSGVAQIYAVNQRRGWGHSALGICVLCILLYMKLIWCSGVALIYAQLKGVHLPWVYVHSSICESYCVQWCCRDLLSVGGYICHGYICILLYVKLFGCSGVSQIYAQLEGVHLPWVYVHSSICQTYWVQWCFKDLCSIGGGPSAMGICAFFYI